MLTIYNDYVIAVDINLDMQIWASWYMKGNICFQAI